MIHPISEYCDQISNSFKSPGDGEGSDSISVRVVELCRSNHQGCWLSELRLWDVSLDVDLTSVPVQLKVHVVIALPGEGVVDGAVDPQVLVEGLHVLRFHGEFASSGGSLRQNGRVSLCIERRVLIVCVENVHNDRCLVELRWGALVRSHQLHREKLKLLVVETLRQDDLSLQRVLEGQVVAERSRRNVILYSGERPWLVDIEGEDLAVKDAANQAELADVEHVGGGEEGRSVVVHVRHPDADGDGEAGIPGSKTLADDADCERGGTLHPLLVQRLGQDKAGSATTRLDWMLRKMRITGSHLDADWAGSWI